MVMRKGVVNEISLEWTDYMEQQIRTFLIPYVVLLKATLTCDIKWVTEPSMSSAADRSITSCGSSSCHWLSL